MKIASFPPARRRPLARDAARHVSEEARTVLASLRGGPPHVARGELAFGLRELRARVRARFLDVDAGAGSVGGGSGSGGGDAGGGEDGGGGDGHASGHSNVGPALPAGGAPAVPSAATTPREEAEGEENADNDDDEGAPQVRVPPPPSPVRGGNQISTKGGRLPPPPLPPLLDEENRGVVAAEAETNSDSGGEAEEARTSTAMSEQQQQRPFTPPASPAPTALSPSTPHSVPPQSSPEHHSAAVPALPVPPLVPAIPNEDPIASGSQTHEHAHDDAASIDPSKRSSPVRPQQQPRPLDPGPYAAPFLAVIVDPRAAGPHTLAALRALYRLLERGSIVQLTGWRSGVGADAEGEGEEGFAHETALEPVARGVLACRFEQTDAGADEAVEMAIADLLRLLVELDATGARAAEAALLRQVRANKAREKRAQPPGGAVPVQGVVQGLTQGQGLRAQHHLQTQQQGKPQQLRAQNHLQSQQQQQKQQQQKRGPAICIRRLPAPVLMESFHAVFVTRLTFVQDGGGHHSPALSFHFEQVLMKMVHCVFGGEDAQSALTAALGKAPVKRSSVLSSRHVGAAKNILEFLITTLSLRKNVDVSRDGWNAREDGGHDGRTLCLRLIRCCLRTGWGEAASPMALAEGTGAKSPDKDAAEDGAAVLVRLIEDDLCLALLTTGQAVWAGHDDLPAGAGPSAPSGPSGGRDGTGTSPDVSLALLSEVCDTLSLLWSLPALRPRLRGQFESIFTGFYQRALGLLRRRPLPEYGAIYEANLAFDAEAEVILESLVDMLCLSSDGGDFTKFLSTIEELFLTYDCSSTESDVASGLLVELSRCCGGVVDEEGEPYLPPPIGPSAGASNGAPAPMHSNRSELKGAAPMLVARHRSVPDHLKELCFEALLGSLRGLFHGAESLGEPLRSSRDGPAPTSCLRKAKVEKRRLHHAARLFNEKPKKGLGYLVDHGMLPFPSNPDSVASFLRNGLVVGLNKPAVGQYLGDLGKSEKETDESTQAFERDWFHRDLLASFCSSFAFQNLTVLDGLRMFLATFRLPGEAQMIDRILQAFAESISQQCVESTGMNLFSTDEKKASDAAYLLSFSIIMLNTDLHNENIRADRKMKLKDFIRNNKNYGKEISDKDLPVEYLEGIYRSIKEEPIKTLGEGADGSMTSERWKDVMRSAALSFRSSEQRMMQSGFDAKDLKELLLESSWQPTLSAVSGLWGMIPWEAYQADVGGGGTGAASSMERQNDTTLMGARLGIDLAYEMLSGASNLSRPDIFQDVFTNVCYMSGLLSEYNRPTEERAENFLHSIEQQSALTVAVNIAQENGDMIGLDGWRCVWGMVFELRDFHLLNGRDRRTKQPNIMKESDPDLLLPEARDEFCRRIAQWDGDVYDEAYGGRPPKHQGMSLMSLVFGSSESLDGRKNNPAQGGVAPVRSLHGKEEFLEWDDLASSDDDEEKERNSSMSNDTEYSPFPLERSHRMSSIGASFENQIIHESTQEMGVTGLERIDQSGPNSLRARVRKRLSRLVDFYGLIAESRYLSEEGLSDTLNSLVEIIRDSSKKSKSSISGENGDEDTTLVGLPLSPASEAFAEILLCEIALKNRDRFALLWNNILCAHYNSRLTYRPSRGEKEVHDSIKLTPGIEKCVTGILRLCVWTSNGRDISIANQVLSMLKILHPPFGGLIYSPLELNLDKHLAEGLWRNSRNVDGLSQIDAEGWSGLLGLVEWCATRGGLRKVDQPGSLAEDDPSLQAFRSLHLILHAGELRESLQVHQWPQIVKSVRCVVEAGERGYCPKLSIAGLDLLQVIHTRMEYLAIKDDVVKSQQLLKCWVPILEAIGEPAEKSRNASVRQQAISLLTDTLLDRHGSRIPVNQGLCKIMNTICIPLAGKRITDLLRKPYDMQDDLEETLIELELCISLLFKPFLHHLKTFISVKEEFVGIWISILGIMTQLLGEESLSQNEVADNREGREAGTVTRAKLFQTTKELGSEHLRNAIMVLAAMGVLINGDNDDSITDKTDDAQEISSVTWAAIGSIGYCKPLLEEWRNCACQ